MNASCFSEINTRLNLSFFTGVPDSLLKPFVAYINANTEKSNHIISANEGNAIAIASGYHLATGKTPCVYLQNSGLGNTINPLLSLSHKNVYNIPMVLVIGWRGEPGLKDAPQHEVQGDKTLDQLKLLDIDYMVIDKKTNEQDLKEVTPRFKESLDRGKSVAFVVKKGALTSDEKSNFSNDYLLKREETIDIITRFSEQDIIVSTTGKTSRELYEIREKHSESHKYDFLTVGSMGHTSSIATGIALQKPNTKVWCLDGDGAVIMHMGSLPVIGSLALSNYVHVVINNEAHESVGGQPTASNVIDFPALGKALGYKHVFSVKDVEKLRDALKRMKNLDGPLLLEVKTAIGSREDLGRPTLSPVDNKDLFMNYLRELK